MTPGPVVPPNPYMDNPYMESCVESSTGAT